MYYFKCLRLAIFLVNLIYFTTLAFLLSILCFVLWTYFGFSKTSPAFDICILTYLLVFSRKTQYIGYCYSVIFDITMLYPTGITGVSFLLVNFIFQCFKKNVLSSMTDKFINFNKIIFSIIFLSIFQFILLCIFSHKILFSILIEQVFLTFLMFFLLFPLMKLLFGKR